MVLDDVAHRAGLVVVPRAFADAFILRHRDQNGLDQGSIPDRFEKRVREPQVVVDAEDLLFLESRRELGVELARRGEVVTQRLLDHDPPRDVGLVSEARGREAGQDLAERFGRSREIEDGCRRAFHDLLQGREGRRVRVVEVNPFGRAGETLVPARILDECAEVLGRLRTAAGADHAHVLAVARDEVPQRRQDLAVREVA